jgi:hypothetical protein
VIGRICHKKCARGSVKVKVVGQIKAGGRALPISKGGTSTTSKCGGNSSGGHLANAVVPIVAHVNIISSIKRQAIRDIQACPHPRAIRPTAHTTSNEGGHTPSGCDGADSTVVIVTHHKHPIIVELDVLRATEG